LKKKEEQSMKGKKKDEFSFREELREILASCSSSVAFND
jgi:hypothetical protein